ncbi:MAG: acyl-CoA dehydrogenase family protein [Candidatus Binataceae bacterium]
MGLGIQSSVPSLLRSRLRNGRITQDHPLDRCFRDSRIFGIYEGAGEIQRLIIARAILGYTSRDIP